MDMLILQEMKKIIFSFIKKQYILFYSYNKGTKVKYKFNENQKSELNYNAINWDHL